MIYVNAVYRSERTFEMDGDGAGRPDCPSCGRPMRFTRAVPRVASLPELRTYKCNQCGVTVRRTERAARRLKSRRFLSTRAEGGERTMDSQITSKSGLANDFWLQMAALAILTIVVIALAAKYVW